MKDEDISPLVRVGVIGAGQLARMMGDEASKSNVRVVVLATGDDESAIATADAVVFGDPRSMDDLRALAAESDVITFDHELVDLSLLNALAATGVTLRPSPDALRFSVDKLVQRAAFALEGLPVPAFCEVRAPEEVPASFFANGQIPVLKAPTGGYDGRGVHFPDSLEECHDLIRAMGAIGPVLVEERCTLLSEVAQMVVRSIDGDVKLYPLVTTVQADGMCNEVRFPVALDDATIAHANDLTTRIAELIGLVGVMAVEYFVTPQGLVINELALRPHNSGHWTIEGCVTSQFANHLLAVSGQPLGDTSPVVSAAVMVNVVGSDVPATPEAAAIDGAFVHHYGKAWRSGRKLGHVTVTGEDITTLKMQAWKSAHLYGTRTQETQ